MASKVVDKLDIICWAKRIVVSNNAILLFQYSNHGVYVHFLWSWCYMCYKKDPLPQGLIETLSRIFIVTWRKRKGMKDAEGTYLRDEKQVHEW